MMEVAGPLDLNEFVLELAQGFEWKVVHGGPRELGVFHWRPSAKLRVQMSSFSMGSA